MNINYSFILSFSSSLPNKCKFYIIDLDDETQYYIQQYITREQSMHVLVFQFKFFYYKCK